MSAKVLRVGDGASVEAFHYGHAAPWPPGRVSAPTAPRIAHVVRAGAARRPDDVPPASTPHDAGTVAAGERDAFATGYAEGERAAIDAAARQLDAQHSRLAQTLDELGALHERLTYRAERQVVELALAVAGRILHREVAVDREVLLAMARVALDRLGDVSSVSVRLHPDDEAAVRAGRAGWPGGSVDVVADANVKPGGCLVQTAGAHVDLSVDAQLREMSTALLGDGSART